MELRFSFQRPCRLRDRASFRNRAASRGEHFFRASVPQTVRWMGSASPGRVEPFQRRGRRCYQKRFFVQPFSSRGRTFLREAERDSTAALGEDPTCGQRMLTGSSALPGATCVGRRLREGFFEFGRCCCRPPKGRGYYLVGSPRQETFWSFSFPGRWLNRSELRPATQHSARRCEGLRTASLALRSAFQLRGGR